MRLVLTGGVTGGHIYPAIAIGDKFKEADSGNEIIYIASGHPLEREIIPRAGYELFEVESEPFYRRNLFKLPITALRNLKGRRQAIRIMKDFKADALISTGSYVSVPVVLAARALHIPIYLHEQNGYPGLSNRQLARYAEKVFIGFEAAGQYFKDGSKLIYSGNPIRSEFEGRDKAEDRKALEIDEDALVILIFGGSQGADTINEIAREIASNYAGDDDVTLIWSTGERYYDEISSDLSSSGIDADNIRIMPYISDMPMMLSACDISISRSGALSVAETAAAGRAAIFVPSPNVTEDHQYYNAKALADAGAAFIVRENDGSEAAANEIKEIIESLAGDRDKLEEMAEAAKEASSTEATEIIYKNIVTPALSDEDKEIAERIRLRKIEAQRKEKRYKRRMIILLSMAAAMLLTIILSFTPIFTVDSIEVKGNKHYSADEIISMGHAAPGKNLIYHSEKGSIQKYLEQNPYIKSAEVQRKLPSTLVIRVSERIPVIAIKYDDDYLLLDREGILLQKSRTKPKLTIVEGNVIKRIKLGQQLGTTDEPLMKKSVELVQTMSDNDLYFVRIDMSDKYSIKAYVYDSLIVKNDYETLVENIKNGKLHMVLDKLFEDSIKRGTITFNEDGTSTFMPGF